MMETTTILIEIFVFLLHQGRLHILQPSEIARDHSWLVEHQVGICPGETTRHHAAALLGSLWCSDTAIVHSTSWRYERSDTASITDHIILTYITIVQPVAEQLSVLLSSAHIQ